MSKKENKEQDILKAAEMLFAEKGFKGATTTLIAAQAGVTHAMLHYYLTARPHPSHEAGQGHGFPRPW